MVSVLNLLNTLVSHSSWKKTNLDSNILHYIYKIAMDIFSKIELNNKVLTK